MRKRRSVWLMVLLTIGLLLPATTALADGDPPNNGSIVWGEDYVLEAGERLNGDLVVFNGDVTLEADSVVDGSVVVWSGSADIEGTVTGDVVATSGNIHLADEATVRGNIVCTWNCDFDKDDGAQVDGSMIDGLPLGDVRAEGWPDFRWVPSEMPSLRTAWTSLPGRILSWTIRALRNMAAMLVLAVVAGLVALLWPQSAERVEDAVSAAPWQSFGMGFLTVVAATGLMVVLAITVCLSPVALLAGLALGVAGLFGWISVGALVGKRLLMTLRTRKIAPMWAAALGTLVISVVAAGLGLIPCVEVFGWLATLVVGCLGLGAVVLTRLGTTRYVPSQASAPDEFVMTIALEEEPADQTVSETAQEEASAQGMEATSEEEESVEPPAESSSEEEQPMAQAAEEGEEEESG